VLLYSQSQQTLSIKPMTYFQTGATSARVTPTEWPPLNIFIRESGRQTFPVADLVYLQAVANYSWLNWVDGRRMLMPRTLKFYAPKLPTELFVRLHRNCVVNKRFVTRLERTDAGGLVHLSTGEVLPISRRRWVTVRRQLMSNLPHLN